MTASFNIINSSAGARDVLLEMALRSYDPLPGWLTSVEMEACDLALKEQAPLDEQGWVAEYTVVDRLQAADWRVDDLDCDDFCHYCVGPETD